MSVSVKNSNPEADKLKEFLTKDGKNVIREQLNKYIVALKEGKECFLVIGFNFQNTLLIYLQNTYNMAF